MHFYVHWLLVHIWCSDSSVASWLFCYYLFFWPLLCFVFFWLTSALFMANAFVPYTCCSFGCHLWFFFNAFILFKYKTGIGSLIIRLPLVRYYSNCHWSRLPLVSFRHLGHWQYGRWNTEVRQIVHWANADQMHSGPMAVWRRKESLGIRWMETPIIFKKKQISEKRQSRNEAKKTWDPKFEWGAPK